jgi:hypothetical protein
MQIQILNWISDVEVQIKKNEEGAEANKQKKKERKN